MTEPLLYLITPPKIDDLEAFAAALQAVFEAGAGTPAEAACLQLRLKDVPDDDVHAVAVLLVSFILVG